MGWAGTMNLDETREAGGGLVLEGFAGHGKEFEFYSCEAIWTVFKDYLP